ncbi:MAG TPA: GGDEF domain-containing protein [Methylibium sp.]|nr:GGDEF domain-containing protein [Methylibium sp.]
MRERRTLLVVGPAVPGGLAESAWGPFTLRRCDTLDEAALQLGDAAHDALLLYLPTPPDTHRLLAWAALSQACLDAAVLLVTDHPTPALASELLDRGVQDVLTTAAATPETVARALHLAIGRKQIERAARKAYATDLATGLPNETQLLEHISHLMALREREPAPMALLVVRIDGLLSAEAVVGAPGVGVLRRKLAVRLRAALRASDVVASIGSDAFAVLLAWMDTPAAAGGVADKLQAALTRPARVDQRELAVAVSIGTAHFPGDGKDARSLLRQAFAAAVGAAPIGRAGFSNIVERGAIEAANDPTD